MNIILSVTFWFLSILNGCLKPLILLHNKKMHRFGYSFVVLWFLACSLILPLDAVSLTWLAEHRTISCSLASLKYVGSRRRDGVDCRSVACSVQVAWVQCSLGVYTTMLVDNFTATLLLLFALCLMRLINFFFRLLIFLRLWVAQLSKNALLILKIGY